jgi:hypothetical protein
MSKVRRMFGCVTRRASLTLLAKLRRRDVSKAHVRTEIYSKDGSPTCSSQ